MALKIVENFDGTVALDAEAKATLFALLTGEAFLSQIGEQLKCSRVEFTSLLFQPVPYSTSTPKGMPAEFEMYHQSDEYAIIKQDEKRLHPHHLCGGCSATGTFKSRQAV